MENKEKNAIVLKGSVKCPYCTKTFLQLKDSGIVDIISFRKHLLDCKINYFRVLFPDKIDIEEVFNLNNFLIEYNKDFDKVNKSIKNILELQKFGFEIKIRKDD